MPMFHPASHHAPNEADIHRLIDALSSDDDRQRAASVQQLIGYGPAAIPSLLAALRHADLTVQRDLATVIAALGDPALDPVLDLLDEAGDTVRLNAINVLREIGNPRAVEPLLRCLYDEDDDIRGAAAVALGHLGRTATRALVSALRDTRWRVRASATTALGLMSERHTIYPLIAALHDPYPQVRAGAARALGQLCDERAVDSLLKALRDSETLVRSQAAIALGRIGAQRAFGPLVTMLRQARQAPARLNAAVGLALLGDVRAIDPLVEALADDSPQVAGWASGALVRFGAEAVDPLLAALADVNGPARARVIWALGSLGDARAIPALQHVHADDPDSALRAAAAKALERLTTSPASADSDPAYFQPLDMAAD